jgi:hypothetical protein
MLTKAPCLNNIQLTIKALVYRYQLTEIINFFIRYLRYGNIFSLKIITSANISTFLRCIPYIYLLLNNDTKN